MPVQGQHKMKISSLFPIAIGMDKLPKELSKDQYSFLVNQPMQENTGNVNSVNAYILECEELKELRNDLLTIIRKYFKAVYSPAGDVDVYITQSWVNFTKPGESHHLHSHSNSFLSGVFYIRSDAETDKIVFHKQEDAGISIDLLTTEWNLYNSKIWWYPVGTGDIILFPSSLLHEVPKTTGNNDRISLAFNVFLKGRIGSYNKLTELKLI
jgi:uncharacterized protein (TIGR02466 family)